MNTRVLFSILLLALGGILAFLPSPGSYRFKVKSGELLRQSLDDKQCFTPDQVAKFVVTQDSSVLLIDVRNPEEYKQVNIPGSVNIPYERLLNKEFHIETYLNNPSVKVIFYSNSNLDAGYAVTIARGLGYTNTYMMKGGLNEWFNTVMNSEFKGDRISARENALFEIRTRARNYFTEINSLPDSLKLRFAQKSRFDPKKLDGGCE